VAAGVCSAWTAPAFADAQGDRVQALEKRLDASVQLIEKLAARIAELERGPAPSPAAAKPADAAQTQAIAALQDSVNQISEGLNRRSADVGVPLHGFADVGAAWSSGKDPIPLRGFNGGTLDLYLTPQFGERVKGLVELAVEYGHEGVAAIDMERLQLGYTVSDALTLWAGRFHTPVGLWNTSFHHGANLQTSIFRPRFIDFEDKGGVVPAHSVGAWASGKTALGGGRVTYDAYLTNSHRIVNQTLDFGAYTDDRAGKMLGGNLGYQFSGALAGLTLGVHGFGTTVRVYDPDAAVLSSTKVRMAGAYLGYDENDWEVIGEYYRFSNADTEAGASRASDLAFVQVGRTFGAYTPFIRYEHVALNRGDNYFRSQLAGRSYRRTAVGLRYALDPKSSIKFELGDSRESAVGLIDATGALMPFDASSYRRGALQYSVAF
jgi:hypothetical protein